MSDLSSEVSSRSTEVLPLILEPPLRLSMPRGMKVHGMVPLTAHRAATPLRRLLPRCSMRPKGGVIGLVAWPQLAVGVLERELPTPNTGHLQG